MINFIILMKIKCYKCIQVIIYRTEINNNILRVKFIYMIKYTRKKEKENPLPEELITKLIQVNH